MRIMKKFVSKLFLSSLLISSGLLFSADNNNTAGTLNTSVQSAMSTWQSVNGLFGSTLQDFCSDCVKTPDPDVKCNTDSYQFECNKNITGILDQAISSAANAAGQGSDTTQIITTAFSTVSNVLPDLLSNNESKCQSIKCDSSKSANSTASTECITKCKSTVTPAFATAQTEKESACDGPQAIATSAECINANKKYMACLSDNLKCPLICHKCAQTDNAQYDNTKKCDSSMANPACDTIAGEDFASYYNNAVQSAKSKAAQKEPICKEKCTAKSQLNVQRILNYASQATNLSQLVQTTQNSNDSNTTQTTSNDQTASGGSKNCSDEPTALAKKKCYCLQVTGYSFVDGACVPTASGGSSNTNLSSSSNNNVAEGSIPNEASGGSDSSIAGGSYTQRSSSSGVGSYGSGFANNSKASSSKENKSSTSTGANASGTNDNNEKRSTATVNNSSGSSGSSSSSTGSNKNLIKGSDIGDSTSKALMDLISQKLKEKYTAKELKQI